MQIWPCQTPWLVYFFLLSHRTKIVTEFGRKKPKKVFNEINTIDYQNRVYTKGYFLAQFAAAAKIRGTVGFFSRYFWTAAASSCVGRWQKIFHSQKCVCAARLTVSGSSLLMGHSGCRIWISFSTRTNLLMFHEDTRHILIVFGTPY